MPIAKCLNVMNFTLQVFKFVFQIIWYYTPIQIHTTKLIINYYF